MTRDLVSLDSVSVGIDWEAPKRYAKLLDVIDAVFDEDEDFSE